MKISLLYVAVNAIIAVLGFLRSFVFLNIFDLADLGTVTLINTAVILIGFFQLGLINGGYRIISLQDKMRSEDVKNLLFTYFIFLLLILSFFTLAFYYYYSAFDLKFTFFIVILGVTTVKANWVSNQLIGSLNYKVLNLAGIVSMMLSFSFAFLSYSYGINGAFVSLFSQPFFFILTVFFLDKNQIPVKLNFDLKLFREILSVGFVPFLTGVIFLAYLQIERWSINFLMGKERLGELFLFFLVSNLWILVPNSINNLFFPRAIKLISENRIFNFKRIIKQNIIIVFIYTTVGSTLILTLFTPIVKVFFPKHIDYSLYVLVAIPGLIFRIFCDPLTLFFNSLLKLKYIFWSDIGSLIIYIVTILYIYLNLEFTLVYFIYCFNVYFFVKFLFLYIPYLMNRKSLMI